MGKRKREYVIIERFSLGFSNRGNSALCYGAVSFLESRHNLKGHKLLKFHVYNNPLKAANRKFRNSTVDIQGHKYQLHVVPVHRFEYRLFVKHGIRLPFTRFGRAIRKIDYVASDYGGDGFSDIYGEKEFYNRMTESNVGVRAGRPLIFLPQTIGPFNDDSIREYAESLLRYASKVYVRDDKYGKELRALGIDYELTADLSSFMVPEPWDVEIDTFKAIGLNVSGLAYSNGFGNVRGEFETYPLLIDKIIEHFVSSGNKVYLIPHSYNYDNPEPNNDDLEAAREVYKKYAGSDQVVLIDKNLTAPQVKYVISRMKFFIGTRMHANFAAIFTKVPLFGLAYSYKFEGAFNNNGLYGQTAMINNITPAQADEIVDKIAEVYKRTVTDNQ